MDFSAASFSASTKIISLEAISPTSLEAADPVDSFRFRFRLRLRLRFRLLITSDFRQLECPVTIGPVEDSLLFSESGDDFSGSSTLWLEKL